MQKKSVFMIVLILFLFASPVLGATIHGTIYDLSLEKAKNIVVEINSSPAQRIISKDGTYSLNLLTGNYKIKAEQRLANFTLSAAEEDITVINEGDYVLDLFLYPNLEQEEYLLNSTKQNITQANFGENTTNHLLILILVVITGLAIAIIILFYRLSKIKHIESVKDTPPVQMPSPKPAQPGPEQEDYLERVIQIIKTEGGRTTQKEIRKHIPLSEAKVSLIITELEAKGIVEKIKRGRGNIIILKKV